MASGTEIFRLFGSIFIDSSQAEASLSKTDDKAKEVQDTLASTVKKAAAWATGTAAAITAATVAVFKVADSVAAVGDEIDKQSQKLGISAQAYQEWDAILGHCGASMDSLKAGMKTLSKAIADGSADQVAAFQAVGLSLDEVQQMSTEDVFAAVITGLQGMEEGAERTNIATTLLGRSAQELGPLLNTSAEATEEMRQTVNDLGGVMSDEAVAASAQFKDALQDLETAAGWFKRELVANILPYVTAGMQGLTNAMMQAKNWVVTLKENFVSFGSSVVTALDKASFALNKFLGKQSVAGYDSYADYSAAQRSQQNRDRRRQAALAGEGISTKSWSERQAEAAAAAPAATTSSSSSSSKKSGSSSRSSASSKVKKTAQVIDALTEKSESVADGITTAIQTVREKYDDGTEHITKTVTESGTKIVDGVAKNYKTITKYVDGVQTKVEKTVEEIDRSVSAIQSKIDKNLSTAKSEWSNGILGTFQSVLTDLKNGSWDSLAMDFVKLIWGEVSQDQRELISKWAADALGVINDAYSGGGVKAAFATIQSLFTDGIAASATEAGTAVQSFGSILSSLSASGGAGAQLANVASGVSSMATSIMGSLGNIVSLVASNPVLAAILGVAAVAGGIGLAAWLGSKNGEKESTDSKSSTLSYKDIQDAYWYGNMRSMAGYDFRTDGYAFGESPANSRLTAYQQKMQQSVDALYNVVQQYLPQTANTVIKLDDGTLVGALAPSIDAQLGHLATLAERGN
nr:MAG TPA: tail tape measure protein [Caudoviricetes sp.]